MYFKRVIRKLNFAFEGDSPNPATVGLAFFAPLSDAGSGAANLALARGVGSATFTRATTATTVNASGLVVAVASGVARSYYDPASLKYLGYLAEEARTNVCLQSGAIQNWANVNTATITANSTTAPDGNTTATTVQDTSATQFSGVASASAAITADTTVYSGSIFVKKTSGATSFPGFQLNFGINTKAYSATLNTDTGVATARTGEVPATIVVANFGTYWRLQISGANAGTTAVQAFFYPAVNTDAGATWSASTTGSAVAWGGQAEAGPFATSYIPTTTVAVARNADVLTYPLTGNLVATVGTAYCEYAGGAQGIQANLISTSATGGGVPLFVAGGNTLACYDGTNTAFFATLPTRPTVTSTKLATRWTGAVASGTVNGGAISTGLFDGDLSVGPTISIGGNSNGSLEVCGGVKNVRIWTRALSDSDMKRL